MHYIVGYIDTPAGRDALALGARLALANGADLEIVMVLDETERNPLVPTSPGFTKHLHVLAQEWLDQASAIVGDAVPTATRIVYANSTSEGLIEAAKAISARIIVVGTAGSGLRGRYTVGSVGNSLVHSAQVPVVLAPAGSEDIPITRGISRITCAIGDREGSNALLEAAIVASRAGEVPLRLVSLIALDFPDETNRAEALTLAHDHASWVLAEARKHLPESIRVTADIVGGKRVEDAVLTLVWDPAEIVLVGSSRLARPRHLFMGSTAAKMLRELPVPMVVVPRDSTLTIGDSE